MRSRQRLHQIHRHPAFLTVNGILESLLKEGFETVLAGGCVRDALLGFRPKDLDVATSAPPEVVERVFENTLAIGKAFGTIIVVENGLNTEVTTFRSEAGYLDGRHPSQVTFTSMAEDAKRRDFTVNALYYEPATESISDFVSGLEDLRQRRLRAVGLARERFEEDHLRILRAARFVAQLGFTLDSETKTAMKNAHASVAKVSAERIFNEMKRLLEARFLRSGLLVLQETQVADVVWPEIQNFDLRALDSFLGFLNWENVFAALSFLVPFNPDERLVAWKAPRESGKEVRAQLEVVRKLVDPKARTAERILALGQPQFASALVLVSGLLEAQGEGSKLETWIADYLDVVDATGELPKPWVGGEDLLAAGVSPSPLFGEALRAAYEAQLERRAQNREEAFVVAMEKIRGC